jgi:hypothetical protein
VRWFFEEWKEQNRIEVEALPPLTPWAKRRAKKSRGSTKRIAGGGLSIRRMTKEAGMGINSTEGWKRGHLPNIAGFDAACNVLGYRISVVPIDANEEDYP